MLLVASFIGSRHAWAMGTGGPMQGGGPVGNRRGMNRRRFEISQPHRGVQAETFRVASAGLLLAELSGHGQPILRFDKQVNKVVAFALR